MSHPHFSCTPNAPQHAHSARRVRHWSAVHSTVVTHLLTHSFAQYVHSLDNPTSHRIRKDNARRSPGLDQTFTRRQKPLRTAFTLGNKKCTENKGWQDRLSPVLGVMCDALLLDKQDRGLSNLALANKRSRAAQDPVAYSGKVIDQINGNMANCIRGRQNGSPSAAELRG